MKILITFVSVALLATLTGAQQIETTVGILQEIYRRLVMAISIIQERVINCKR